MGVEFEEGTVSGAANSKIMYSRFQPSDKKPWLVSLLLRTGIIKRESQAIYVLIVFCIVCITASIYIYKTGSKPPEVNVDFSRFNISQ